MSAAARTSSFSLSSSSSASSFSYSSSSSLLLRRHLMMSSSLAACVTLIEEGSARIEYEGRAVDTRTKGQSATEDGPVFYNKVQVFNRDLSVVMIALYAQWRYIERAEARARRSGATPEEKAANAARERGALYALSAAELDARLEASRAEDGLTIMDALAATGLRSVRYAKEIPGVKRVYSNDVEVEATQAARRNIASNGVGEDRCEALNEDAVLALLRRRGELDVVDVDPYGSAAPFMDAAVQALAEGGLLCLTCTDLAVLSGNYPEVCFAKYGAMPTKARHMHEFSLRVVLHAIEAAAARYQRHIVPVLSVSVDFYLRVFVRVYRRPIEVKRSCTKRHYVFQSTGCPTFYLQPLGRATDRAEGFGPGLLHFLNKGRRQLGAASARRRRKKAQKDSVGSLSSAEEEDDEEDQGNAGLPPGVHLPLPPPFTPADYVAPAFCPETGAPLKVGGPVWTEPIHDPDWVTAALDRLRAGVDAHLSTSERLIGVLTAVSEELVDVPLYYTLPDLCGTLHCSSPKMAQVKAALAHAGFRCSQTHRDPDAIKTDAPPRLVWEVMRAWCQKHPVNPKRLADMGTAAAKILAKEPSLPVNFNTTAAMRAKPKARRWAPNPEENWGPKAAAYGRKKRRDRP